MSAVPQRRFSDRHDLPVVAFRTLCACTAALVIADGAFTYIWLTTGAAVEGNPALAWLIDAIGTGWAIAVRTVTALGLIAAAAWLAPHARRVAAIGMAVAATAYALVLTVHLAGWAAV